jgi:hypothetical protein
MGGTLPQKFGIQLSIDAVLAQKNQAFSCSTAETLTVAKAVLIITYSKM